MRHVTLRQLRIFDALAHHLSFSRAAKALHLTQPAVSMQVKQIEAAAGLPLVEQVGKKVALTEAGRALLQHAHLILGEVDAAEQAMASLRGVNQGTLAIALISTAKYFAPRFLAEFCAQYPGVKLKLEVDNRARLLQRLLDNEMELGVMGHPPRGMNIVAEPFARNPHAVIANPSHRFAAARHLPLSDLAGENFLVREPGSGTRRLMEHLFAEHGMKINATMEISSDETIKQATMAGMGLAFLSLHTVQLELQTGRLVMLDVREMPVMREWYVVHGKGKRLSPVAKAFREFLLAKAPESGEPAIPRAAKRRRGRARSV